MTTVYGIRNCDTMKKAFAWLDGHGIAYAFHDYKKLGADAALLKQWAAQAGWERLINTRGPSFRKLPPAKQANLTENKAFALMVKVSKPNQDFRFDVPVIGPLTLEAARDARIRALGVEAGKTLLIGFDPDEYAQKLK